MPRIGWISAAVALAALLLVVLVVALLPRETLKTRIGEQIAAWTGREVSLRGEPDLDFFPKLTVTLKDVEVGGPPGMPDAGILSMDRLEGTIRLLPLIIGRVEVGSFTMVRPRVKLVRDNSGSRNWTFDSGAAALQLAFAGDVPLGDFVLEDGTVLYENRQTGTSERLDSVNLAVTWPSVRQPISVSGFAIWRGEQVSFRADAEAPFAYLNGAPSPVTARIDSVPVTFTFEGEGSGSETPKLAGRLNLTTPSLRGFASWLGSPIGPGSTLGEASLSGAAIYRAEVLSVNEVELALDDNNSTGALQIALGAVPKVTGTLAFPALDLSPYFASFSPVGGGESWRALTPETDWLHDVAADIRLSAGSVTIGPLAFGETAASVSVADGRMEIGLAESGFQGGTLSGALAVVDRPKDEGAEFRAKLRAADFDLAGAAATLALPQGLSGTATAAADVTASGKDLGTVFNALGGTARLDVENGRFPLFGIAEIGIAGAGANPSATGIARATPVKALSAGFSFSRGVAILERASVSGLAFTADPKGWIGLADGSLGLNGTVRPVTAGTEGAEVPFTIDGTLATPLARPLAAAN